MIVGASGQLLADGDLEPEECVVKITSLLRYVCIFIITVVHIRLSIGVSYEVSVDLMLLVQLVG